MSDLFVNFVGVDTKVGDFGFDIAQLGQKSFVVSSVQWLIFTVLVPATDLQLQLFALFQQLFIARAEFGDNGGKLRPEVIGINTAIFGPNGGNVGIGFAIPANMMDNEVASLFERYNWLSAPVVDENNKLLGRITIDDVVDIIREDAEHSMMSMAGLEDEEDTFAPVVKSTQRRSIWLGVNLVTALMAAAVSDLFEATLSQLAVLAILNTIVPSMGGVAGNQTLTLVIRGMALDHVNSANARWLISKELAIGFLNGIIWSVLIASVIAIWKQDLMLGAVIAFAMMINMVAAGLAGACLPIIMKRLKIDPALAGSVILTTITDVVGIFAFLGTATWLLV